jgi:endonuclease/exonuclease/phosphatase family metal-dependent hydrolase
MGTLAVADLEVLETEERLTVASVYGLWEAPLRSRQSGWIYADASVHRVLSDLSALVGREMVPPLIVAGDLNLLHGYGEMGSPYWRERYETVFARARAIGLRFIGPQAPEGGHPAIPRPDELPAESRNIPTFRTRSGDPTSAQRQLDFVFASDSLAERVTVRALHGEEQWGPSDHCRIQIEVEPQR